MKIEQWWFVDETNKQDIENKEEEEWVERVAAEQTLVINKLTEVYTEVIQLGIEEEYLST